MNWTSELTHDVTPKSGPMRAMRPLRDVNYAFLEDLTPQCRYRRHWFAVGRLLMAAANGGGRLDIMLATDALLMALEVEGWMTRAPRARPIKRGDIARPPTRRIKQPSAPMKLAA
jgi:hypothetical protein